MATRALGKLVSNAGISGRRTSTKRMRNIRSMCRDIEQWDVNEVQIPGKKIEPQWPFLDALIISAGYALILGEQNRIRFDFFIFPSPTIDVSW